MRMSDLLAMMRRRWLVTIFGTLLTLLATVGVYTKTPVRYEGTAQFYLLPSPVSPTTGEIVNPYLDFGPSLRITVEVVARLVTTSTAVEQAKAVGATAEYEVGIPTDASGPVVNIVAGGPDKAAVLTTVSYVADQLAKTLEKEQRQSEAPPQSWVTIHPINEEPMVAIDNKGRYTKAAAVLIVAALLTLAAVVLVDRFRLRRARIPATPPTDRPRPKSPTAVAGENPAFGTGTAKHAAHEPPIAGPDTKALPRGAGEHGARPAADKADKADDADGAGETAAAGTAPPSPHFDATTTIQLARVGLPPDEANQR